MKFSVDRIEEYMVVVQNLTTKEMIELPKNILPNNITDGSVIKFENNQYIIDVESQNEREKIIKEKMERLKKLKTSQGIEHNE